jgi:phospholipid N-methyltransferase
MTRQTARIDPVEPLRPRHRPARRGRGTLTDLRLFLRAWMRDPLGIASVAPSSRALARLITSRIGPADGPVVELGPGTGVFTQALLERGVRERDLTLVEANAAMVTLLRRRFPEACVLHIEASRLAAIDAFEGRAATAAVSGLPLLWMPRPTVERILRGLFARLHADGALYQFTYQLWCPVPRAMLDRLGLHAERIGWTPANLPPAAVYRIARRSPD